MAALPEDELNTSVEVIDTDGLGTPSKTGTTIRVKSKSYRRPISSDEKTVRRNNRRMNRISSHRRHRHAVSEAQSTERVESAMDKLAAEGSPSDSGDDCGIVIHEVREYKQEIMPSLTEPAKETLDENTKNDKTASDMVRGGYSPNKSTLGLELVASPSLLGQVWNPAGNASVGGSTLTSTRSFRKEMEQGNSFDRFADTVAPDDEVVEYDDDTCDDESTAYSAMGTVAQTVISVKESIRDTQPTPSVKDTSVHQPLPLRKTYSMRSIKSSEGMEVGDLFLNGPNSNGMEKEEDLSTNKKSKSHPFDKMDAQIIASSKAAATTNNSTTSPTSCLRPSSFSTQKSLVSPALLSSGRAHRSTRMAKFRHTFDRRPVAARNQDTSNETSVTITQVEQKKGREVESHSCFTVPGVSFAGTLKRLSTLEEKNKKGTASSASLKDGDGTISPTSVNEFFSEEVPHEEVEPNPKENNNATTTTLTNRLARNRKALKSIAMAKESAKVVRKKHTKGVKEISDTTNVAKEEEILSPAEQEGTASSIVKSVNDLDAPQSSSCIDDQTSEVDKTNVAENIADSKEIMTSQPNHDEEDISPSIELDASILLNTSDESINTRKKRFHLPRLLRKKEGSGTPSKSSSKSPSGKNGKKSMRMKLFGGKTKEEVTTHEEKAEEKVPVKMAEEKTPEELAKIKEVEKYTAWLAPSTEPAEDDCPVDDSLSPEQEDSMISTEQVEDTKDETTTSSTPPALGAAVVASVAIAGAISPSGNTNEPSTSGLERTEAANTFMLSDTEKDTQVSKMNNPISFFGARDRSSSSKHSKTYQVSKTSSRSSFASKLSLSPKRVSLEPSDVESPSRVNSSGTSGDGKALLGNDSSPGEPIGDAISNNNETMTSKDTSCETKNSSFEQEMANSPSHPMFPEFGFVGNDASGEIEHGVEVEWDVSVLGPNEFGDKGISLDTTAVFGELEKNLSEQKLENITKVGDDMSWPSVVTSKNDEASVNKISDEDTSLKLLNDSPRSGAEDKLNVIDETSIISGGTKSTLNPRKLFRRRSKGNDHRKLKEDEEESTISDLKRFVSRKKRSPHPAEKRSRRDSSRYHNIVGKDDSRLIDEDSEYYSSDDYSSDGREDADVVGAIATHIHKGLTGIVDMMETAFAFNKDEDTIDFDSESSDSEEEDDDSYIQRKMASRRDRQRKLLHEARRSSQRRRRHSEGRKSRSSRHTRTRDNESIASEKRHRRRSGYKSSRQRYASSGRALSRRRAEEL